MIHDRMSNELKNLIGCFTRGLALTPLQSRNCAMIDPSATLQSFADYYRTTPATVCRWRKAGVDLCDPVAVGLHVLTLQRADIDLMESILDKLYDSENNDPQLTADGGELQ